MRRLSVFSLSFQKLGFSLAKRENPASPAGAQEGRHQWFPPSDFLPFPKIIWCKPENSDLCEKENGRGFFLSCRSLTIRNVRYLAAAQAVSSPQARHKVNCPKGTLGDDRDAQLVGLVATDGTCEFNLIMNVYRRVRQGELPEGQEKVPWGTTSAHRAIRLALNKNEKMENAPSKVHSPFSIFNSQLFRGFLSMLQLAYPSAHLCRR